MGYHAHASQDNALEEISVDREACTCLFDARIQRAIEVAHMQHAYAHRMLIKRDAAASQARSLV